MKKKILFINKIQYGYHSDAYMYSKYLKDDFEITFLSLDLGKKRIELEGVKTIYVPSLFKYQGYLFSIIRNLIFYIIAILLIILTDGIIFVFYFKGADILKKVLFFKKMFLCVCTLSVYKDIKLNKEQDLRLLNTTKLYDIIIILSEGMKQRLNLNHTNVHIVPLGSDIISSKKKDYSKFVLLYVGTLTNRDIHKTLYGLKMFIDRNPQVEIEYHIIGDGNTPDELEYLKMESNRMSLNDKVYFYGRIPNVELKPFFDKCNYGISFVPKTEYFDYQPVTKTFEYSMSGLFVIGTSTSENKKVISSKNGILIEDSSHDFMKSLETIMYKYKCIDEASVRTSLLKYKWENIVLNELKPILLKYYN